jgi:hypothetical protein
MPDFGVFQLYVLRFDRIGNFEYSQILSINFRPFSNVYNLLVS